MTELRRALYILYLALRYRMDQSLYLLPRHKLPVWLRILLFFNPLRLVPAGKKSFGLRMRLMLEALGPVFIKFGQVLSTRRDLLSHDTAEELQLLQDQIEPFTQNPIPFIETALGQQLDAVFLEFNVEPLAAASVAQVHQACLRDGAAVVVKIIRPGIEAVIRKDLKLLHALAALATRYLVYGPRLRPAEIVADYEETIMAELDLLKEAANTARLRYNFAHSPLLYVPKVHWEHCRQNLLVLEKIEGTSIGRVDDMKAAGINMKVLAARGVEIFFTQVFQHNFFHADMHPGNIFVDTSIPEKPSYIAVDCAIIGILNKEHQYYLAQNLLAFFRRDYRKVATLHVESGWVSEDTDIDSFAAVVREVCDPIFEKPLHEISFGQLVLALFVTAQQFNMEVQPELVLLQKTLLNVEGLGRQLYPELNLWETAKPLLEKWLIQQVGPAAFFQNLATHAPELISVLPTLPEFFVHAGSRLDRLDRIFSNQAKRLTLMREQQRAQQHRLRRQNRLLLLLATGFFGICSWWLNATFGVSWLPLTVGGAIFLLFILRI